MLTYYLHTWLIIVLYWYIVLYIDVVFLFFSLSTIYFSSVQLVISVPSLLFLLAAWYSVVFIHRILIISFPPMDALIASNSLQKSCNKSLWAYVRLSEYYIQNPSGWVLKLKKKKVTNPRAVTLLSSMATPDGAILVITLHSTHCNHKSHPCMSSNDVHEITLPPCIKYSIN